MLRGLTLNGCYRLGIVKQVQRGTITLGLAAAAGTLTINPVVAENTIVHVLGVTTDGVNANTMHRVRHARGYLNSTTSIGATLTDFNGSNYTKVSVEAIEFYPGVVRVQRGTVTNTGPASTGSTTINAVVTGKTFLNWLGWTMPNTGADFTTQQVYSYTGYIELNSATSVRLTVDATSPLEMTHGFEVVELLMNGLNE